MFESEEHILRTIADHNELVRLCVVGKLSFAEFLEKYNDFYSFYALDGHESDDEERALFEKHERLIEPHRAIAHEILGQLCLESDAKLESYKQAGRFGPVEALEKLRNVRLNA